MTGTKSYFQIVEVLISIKNPVHFDFLHVDYIFSLPYSFSILLQRQFMYLWAGRWCQKSSLKSMRRWREGKLYIRWLRVKTDYLEKNQIWHFYIKIREMLRLKWLSQFGNKKVIPKYHMSCVLPGQIIHTSPIINSYFMNLCINVEYLWLRRWER